MKRVRNFAILFLLILSDSDSLEIFLEDFGPTFTEPIEIKNAGDDRLFVVNNQNDLSIASLGGNIYKIFENLIDLDDFSEEKFKIYPNPSSGILFLDLMNQNQTVFTINIYSLWGN